MISFYQNGPPGTNKRRNIYDGFGIIRSAIRHISYKNYLSLRCILALFFRRNILFPDTAGKFPHCPITPLNVSYEKQRFIILRIALNHDIPYECHVVRIRKNLRNVYAPSFLC